MVPATSRLVCTSLRSDVSTPAHHVYALPVCTSGQIVLPPKQNLVPSPHNVRVAGAEPGGSIFSHLRQQLGVVVVGFVVGL